MIPDILRKDVICIDTETAVLGDHVCEVGISLFKNAELVHEWSTLVKPIVPLDPKSSEIHKIYEKDLVDAPSFSDIAFVVYNYLLSADVVVAYNYEYDRIVLGNEFQRVGWSWPAKPMIDPMVLFKQYHKFNKGKTLIKAAEKYGVKYIGAHRACNDATVTGKILFKMAATRPDFPKNIQDMIRKQRQWLEAQHLDFSSYLIGKGKEPPNPPQYQLFEINM